VTRVAREVGTEGKLGGQAEVPEVAGTWKDSRQRQLHGVEPDRAGPQHRRSRDRRSPAADLSKKSRSTCAGEIHAAQGNTLNTMVEQLRSFARK